MVLWDGSEVEGRFLIGWDCHGVMVSWDSIEVEGRFLIS